LSASIHNSARNIASYRKVQSLEEKSAVRLLSEHYYTMCCRRVRKLKTKGAWLVLLWNFLVQATVFSPMTFNYFSSYNYDNDLDDLFLIRGLLLMIAQLLLLPIFGWLADVHFGRRQYKTAKTIAQRQKYGQVFR